MRLYPLFARALDIDLPLFRMFGGGASRFFFWFPSWTREPPFIYYSLWELQEVWYYTSCSTAPPPPPPPALFLVDICDNRISHPGTSLRGVFSPFPSIPFFAYPSPWQMRLSTPALLLLAAMNLSAEAKCPRVATNVAYRAEATASSFLSKPRINNGYVVFSSWVI